jgi:hypothetical protein
MLSAMVSDKTRDAQLDVNRLPERGLAIRSDLHDCRDVQAP